MAGFWTRFKADKMALVMAAFLGIVILLSLLAPLIAPYNPAAQDIANKFAPPSAEHLLGTDQLGRDILSRILWGGQVTVLWSLATMFCTIGIGIVLGVIAGYYRGRIDEVIMRFCDIMLSFPNEVLILAIIGVLGTGIFNILLAMVIAKWAWYVRMIRSIMIQFMDKNYIYFARVSGCSARHIIQNHLLPGAMGEICVLATLDAGGIILNISALSFLGLGVQPPNAEWGMMLNEAKKVLTINPWQMLPPGFAIFLVVAAFNFLGDSVQEALDPQLNKSSKKRLSIFKRKKAVA
ncbi:Glutathione transport system permease protein GsiD [Sporomusa ovata DSM 2662]|uniref:Nickel transport system permease protein NikC (TC 3.A.1.5.3) n=1 Tax=Sporomusa ovata TaxID=2378 RepID=A0A0U1L455_9FIRM|nr:nickel/cobalt ABC transporter permease [Sporomusa ovata]EQB25891.1 ABC-type dipeptide/oligopeptide/nickel transport system, permease component [Sporomusa ovata DSM 2662]CQR74466.1 Nickel transport system permease protein NikC (TC 3.A.1.5.3) [Sporomusa ovata]